MSRAGLYIHFPFCRRICFYCHFFKKKHHPDLAAECIGQMLREMQLRSDPCLQINTIYFGGGSPSLMDPGQVARFLEAAAKYFRLSARPEVTLEANPEDLTVSWLRRIRSAGVNRLSVGAQSFQDRDLRFLQRTHDAACAIGTIAMARDAGFANISIDLMIGLPTQEKRSMARNLSAIEALAPSHVSAYILENVPRTEDENRDFRLYHQVGHALAGLGYRHYEVSNFALPGRASRHNLKYWSMEPYVAIGPSAAGFSFGRDYRNVPDLNKYRTAVGSGKLPEVKTKQMVPGKRRIITALRLLQGIPSSALASFPDKTNFLLREGFLVRRGRNIAVPEERILLLNEILEYFV